MSSDQEKRNKEWKREEGEILWYKKGKKREEGRKRDLSERESNRWSKAARWTKLVVNEWLSLASGSSPVRALTSSWLYVCVCMSPNELLLSH